MKISEPLQRWLVLKYNSSWHPGYPCWTGRSKGQCPLHIMHACIYTYVLSYIHRVSRSHWSHSKLGQETPVLQESPVLSWTGQKAEILECHQRRGIHILKGPYYIINYQKVRSNMLCLLIDPAILQESIGDGKQLCVGVPYDKSRNCWKRRWIELQVTEVKAIQLASDIAEQEKEPILYADSWIVANTWGLVATKEEE